MTLNRPDAGNAMSLAFVEQLSAIANAVAEDASVRCVLLTGTGRFFSVGGDIGAFREAGEEVPRLLEEVTRHLHKAVALLVRMEKPLVTAINGPAAGAGLGLAVLGDIAIAAEGAHFSMAYTAIGLTPDAGTSAILPRLVGLRKTQELALTNRRVPSGEAVEIGLITKVVPADDLLSEAREAARKLADGPAHAFGAVRKLLASGFELSFEDQLAREAETISQAAGEPEGREGITAFLEKRPAVFRLGQIQETA
ncbi:enoyl-CoA hydratase/isomerase family protein [Novosphingobium naphthalenivorans]|uniref:enoyl-CoA hydratase/isomerase family protein n=1 Tax=Novosphingobium naphthalenivorans TaxID=273168 RepID=UPI0008329467|nr:enoyl-CoA hydratase-related protein [Novosphingobium naphthalenivorans]